MITRETDLYVQLPEESAERILHPGDIHDIAERAVTFAFEEPHIAPEPASEVLAFYELNRKFHKQPATISMLWAEDDRSFVVIDPAGDPVPAESREVYRVSTTLAEINADLGSERNCTVTDVSAAGLSLVSSQRLQIGRTSAIRICFEGATHTGVGCVQSIKQLPTGRTRYGMSIAGGVRERQLLATALQTISAAVQRRQLRRLAGA